jgi:hypothetical protein
MSHKPFLMHLFNEMCPLFVAVAIAACGQVVQTHNAIHQRDAAMEAASAKMIVTESSSVAGHSQFQSLGKVRGHCLTNNNANDVIASGDNLKEAAYRKYGAQVDAIVDATAFHVNDDYSPETPPDTQDGHYECEGTAIRFSE